MVEMKDKINVLFVCGYGVGSSAISETLVKRGLEAENIDAEVQHTAVGEMESFKDWVDVIAISTKLAEGINFPENVHVVQVVNIMDGKGIAKMIGEVVDEFYPEARKG